MKLGFLKHNVFPEVLDEEKALIASSTITSEAKFRTKQTHKRMCVFKKTHWREKFDIIAQPGDCPGLSDQWTGVIFEVKGKQPT